MKRFQQASMLLAFALTSTEGMCQTGEPVVLTLSNDKPDKKDIGAKPLDASATHPCQDYYVYYVGKGEPRPPQLQWVEVKDFGTLPGAVRFSSDRPEEVKYYRAAIGRDLCGVPIRMTKGDSAGHFFLQAAHVELSRSVLPTKRGASCLDGCDPCSAFSKYRVVYDVSTDEICVQRWERPRGNRPARWVPVNDRIIRPGVNRMVDVKYVNYNALRDSLSLDFQWDQYNLEGSADFQNAVMRGPTTPPAAAAAESPDKTEEGKGAGGTKPDSTNATLSIRGLSTEDCDKLKKGVEALRSEHVDLITQLKKDHTKVDLKKFKATVKTILEDQVGLLDLDGEMAYRNQLDSAFKDCKASWTKDEAKINAALITIRGARDTLQRKLDLDALAAMSAEYEAVEKKAKAAPVTPSHYDLRDTLVNIARRHFPKRFAGSVDTAVLKALADVVDKAKDGGLLTSNAAAAYKKKVDGMAKTYDDLTTYRTNSLAPLQMHDYDVLRLQFKKNGKALNASAYEIHTSGGWKIDFSSGVVFSQVRDEQYFYKALRSVTTTSSDTTVTTSGGDTTITINNVDSTRHFGTVGAETPNEVDWGLTVMAHFYPRTGLVFNPAISLGMLVKQDGVSPMLGFSMLYGRKHRVALTGGAIFANVLRLDPGYAVDTEYGVTSDTGLNSEVPNTERVIRVGFFASLPYNFAGARLTTR